MTNSLTSSPFKTNGLKFFILLLFSALLLTVSLSAFGQAAGDININIQELQKSSKGYETDSSRGILWGLLGDFAENPLKASATPTSLIGQIFLVFNVTLFVLGVGFMGYTVVMSIAVSAHEGEIMGKRMSSLWVPIRYGFGVLGMIPAFGGFSLAQGVMMFFAILGIGLANLMTETAINSAANFDNIMAPPSMFKQGPTPHENFTPELAAALFGMNVCASATATYKEASMLGRTSTVVFGAPEVTINNSRAKVKNSSNNCGAIDIVNDTGFFSGVLRVEGKLGEDYADANSYRKAKLGFRNNAVAYKQINRIAEKSVEIKPTLLIELNDKVRKLANDWYVANVLPADGAAPYPYPLEEINKAALDIKKEHDNQIEKAFAGEDMSRIKDDVRKTMIDGGWTGIGSWFSTFAEVSSTLQSAAMASHFEIIPPNHKNLTVDQGTKDLLIDLYAQQKVAHEQNTCWLGFVDENPTGACAPLQNTFLWGLGKLIDHSGGEGMVNPIIAAKNIGDWMLSFVGTMAGTAWLIDQFDNADEELELTKGLEVTKSKGVAEKFSEGMSGSLASLLLTMSLILGITFAVYIPFVPFLTWFSGLVSYFASVLEGLVAAQVWAFSHLQTEGEGMGQRAEKGYLFVLNMLLRPALMVLGFFFASGILTLLGSFFFNQFATALANVQGSTITGPFIMFGSLIVVGLALLTLIQTVFNLIYEIPDRVIAWFGGGMEARMAKDMDRGIEQGANQAARWAGGTALGSVMVGGGGGRGRR